jgi:hypothetical protein
MRNLLQLVGLCRFWKPFSVLGCLFVIFTFKEGFGAQQYGIPRTIPPTTSILAASGFLANDDIPQDNFLPPTNTLYVGSNAPYTNVEDAIAFANANPATPCTIYIEGGVYYYKSTGDAFLYGQNIERGNLYITSVPGETVELRPVTWTNAGGTPNSIWTASAFQINGGLSNVTVESLTFAGWQTLFNFNYSSAPSSNLTFKNIECTDFRYRDGDTNEYRSIIETAYNDPGIFSTPDEFTNAESYQYQIYGLILSNIYVENTDIGVNIGDEQNPNVRGVRISNVNIYDPVTNYNNTALDGIAVVNCYKVLIDDSTVVNVVGDGIDTKSWDISVVNCFIDNPARQGVKFWWNGEMINTIVYDANSPDDAIYLWRQGPIRMINCDTIHKPQVGYAAENGTANVQDTAPTTEQPIYLINDIWAFLPRGAFFETTNVISLDSCYFDFTNGYPLITSINNEGTQLGLPNIYTTTQMNGLPDCGGNNTNNPDFLNFTNFELAPQSPYVAAGTNYGGTINGKSLFAPAFDFYGAERRVGLAPDVGAVAFSATLNFSVSSNQLTLTWAGPFYLQQNTNLANAAGWRNIPGGTNSPFSIPISAGNLYVRLHSDCHR